MKTDTIAAISTGLMPSGIGKVRISGSDAIVIADRIFKSKCRSFNLLETPTHTVHYGMICDGERIIDEVLLTVMRKPRSFTTEDTVEIDCHGGIVVMKKILQTCLKYGARLAEPGEFTKRAFLNGRIDLSQAEAVIDIIHSENEYALDQSVKQLKGNVREAIEKIRYEILGSIAFIEAALDDPEHISADGYGNELKIQINDEIDRLNQLLRDSENGRLIREGLKTVILGKPNAGKSSLLNYLSGEERAIVTDVAGTTRDTLEETVNLDGVILHLIDTAGIRETDDVVEMIGVKKARASAEDADLAIFVADASVPLDENDIRILELIKDKKTIILLNKTDLQMIVTASDIRAHSNGEILEVSVKKRIGMDQLSEMIRDMFFNGDITFNNQVCLTNMRHQSAVNDAIESLNMVISSIDDGMPEDFFSIDLMSAYQSLGEITGDSVDEDLVDRIFSDFCMGK